ncbi:hypothetical protein MMC09_000985 [Bachmanniomyces sp. S44760]|nr:hypothetical protein [Bachmanniomyces sp. S44760]
MFAKIEDFEPVVAQLVKAGAREPYDWDAYAESFFPAASKLMIEGEEAERAGKPETASQLYLRASALYRIARFPIPRSPQQKVAWERNKIAALKGISLFKDPVQEVHVEHIHAIEGDGKRIPIYFAVPPGASKESPVPCVIIMTGLDGYRTELILWEKLFRSKGCALIVVEIPGTGDSPALKNDPVSPDREWSSLLDWIETQPTVDPKRLVVWGFSTGGYYSLRIAHTHADRLLGAVSLGGGCHRMFDREWTEAVNHLEYPFDLADSMAYKFGYPDVESYIQDARGKFSLLEAGILDMPCTRLLCINGMLDEIFPVEDYMLALQHGSPKETRFVPGTKHMGEPTSFGLILPWIEHLIWGQ